MDHHHAALVTGMPDETAEMPEDVDLCAGHAWGRGQAAVCGRIDRDEHVRHALLCPSYEASAYVWAVQTTPHGACVYSPWQPDEPELHRAGLRDLMVRLLLLPAGQASRRPTRLDGPGRAVAELCGAGPGADVVPVTNASTLTSLQPRRPAMLPTLPNALRALVLAALGSSATGAWAGTPATPPTAASCSPAARQAAQQLGRRVTGKPYEAVRRQFLAAGWQPAPVQEMDRGRFLNTPGGPEDHLGGQERVLYRKGYDEVDVCAVDGGVPCILRFQNKTGNRLRVDTLGEELPKFHSTPRVIGLELICPSRPPDVSVKAK